MQKKIITINNNKPLNITDFEKNILILEGLCVQNDLFIRENSPEFGQLTKGFARRLQDLTNADKILPDLFRANNTLDIFKIIQAVRTVCLVWQDYQKTVQERSFFTYFSEHLLGKRIIALITREGRALNKLLKNIDYLAHLTRIKYPGIADFSRIEKESFSIEEAITIIGEKLWVKYAELSPAQKNDLDFYTFCRQDKLGNRVYRQAEQIDRKLHLEVSSFKQLLILAQQKYPEINFQFTEYISFSGQKAVELFSHDLYLEYHEYLVNRQIKNPGYFQEYYAFLWNHQLGKRILSQVSSPECSLNKEFGSIESFLKAVMRKNKYIPFDKVILKFISAKTTYTDDELLWLLQYHYKVFHRSPTSHNGLGFTNTPPAELITRRFKTWNNALEKAGLKLNAKRGVFYSDEELLEFIKDACDILGEIPSKEKYDSIPDFPRSATIAKRLGGWNNALRLAGLEIVRESKRWNLSRAELIAILQKTHAVLGRKPTSGEIGYGILDFSPTFNSFVEEFGSWKEALTAAKLIDDINIIPEKDKHFSITRTSA